MFSRMWKISFLVIFIEEHPGKKMIAKTVFLGIVLEKAILRYKVTIFFVEISLLDQLDARCNATWWTRKPSDWLGGQYVKRKIFAANLHVGMSPSQFVLCRFFPLLKNQVSWLLMATDYFVKKYWEFFLNRKIFCRKFIAESKNRKKNVWSRALFWDI